MAFTTSALRWAGFGLICGYATSLQPLAAQSSIYFPKPGVVCDVPAQICYDNQGISMGLTAETFGNAAQQRLVEQFRNNPLPREFRLSNGKLCSVNLQRCFDGWDKRNIAQDLTKRMYGNTASNNNNSNTATAAGLCSLSRGGMALYDGRCEMREVSGNGNDKFRIQLGNGALLRFVNRGNGFQIQVNNGGSWPVAFIDHGPTAIFRWANNVLVATQQNPPQGQLQPGSNRPLLQFLDSIFR
jgi:hypothetical protein